MGWPANPTVHLHPMWLKVRSGSYPPNPALTLALTSPFARGALSCLQHSRRLYHRQLRRLDCLAYLLGYRGIRRRLLHAMPASLRLRNEHVRGAVAATVAKFCHTIRCLRWAAYDHRVGNDSDGHWVQRFQRRDVVLSVRH